MKERPFGDIEKFRKKTFQKKTKNENVQQSHSAEKCKWGPLGFFNIYSGAKHQKK